jgi:predicted nucleotidyltransferase
MSDTEHSIEEIEGPLKKAAGALKEAGVPFLVGGSLAAWARGGPDPRGDLDLMVKAEDAERALKALVDVGMKPERPPEGWLLKAWDGEVMIDLIFDAIELPITDEAIARGDELNVFSIPMRVMALEDVIATKLLTLNEHNLDYHSLLQMVRSVREQLDWGEVRARTASSPYARAFFALLDELGIETAGEPSGSAANIRVLPGPEQAKSS